MSVRGGTDGERTRTDQNQSNNRQTAQTAHVTCIRFLPVLVFLCLWFGSLAVSCLLGLLGVCLGWKRRGKDQDRPKPQQQQTNRTNRTNDNYAVCPRLLLQLCFSWFFCPCQCGGLCIHCRGLLLESGGSCFSLVLLGFPLLFNVGGSVSTAGGSFWRAAAAVSAWCCLVSFAFQCWGLWFQCRLAKLTSKTGPK